jgi:hypothetical protein
LLERGKRLASMGPKELALRTRQAVAKRWDAIAGNRVPRWRTDNSCAGAWLEAGQFFFDRENIPHILECLRDRLPGAVEEIIERAERICRHRFDLLGYEDIDYGPEIDWHADGVHGKRAPRRPWFKVPYLDFAQVGDHKIIWELNRHQHLVTLAKAYRLTEEERYARELFSQWYHWRRQNPPGIGINWASSLEVAFRSLSWIWVRHLLDGCPIVPQRFPIDLGRAMMSNGRHIERFLSTYFSPNTHLLGEGVALFFIGALCPGLPLAHRWRARGWQIVLNQAHRQVLADGMHFEQSVYYHVYALDFFLHSRILADVNRIPVPAAFDRVIEKMLEVVAVLRAAGPLPQLGDDDGGRVFDPRRNCVEHLVDPLATGAVLFNRSDFKAVAEEIREETVWLLGAENVKQFDVIPARKRQAESLALESSGLYVMVTSKPVGQRVVIDAGPQGAGRAGHGHADALSMQLAVNGQELLVDQGTLTYVGCGEERDRFRGTSAHNTVVVDGFNQAEPSGPFGWQRLPNMKVHWWRSGTNLDVLDASHDGYCRFKHGVRHRRFVVYAKPHFWLVRDLLEGEGCHQIDLHWHFAGGEMSIIPGGFKFFSQGQALLVFFATTRACTEEIQQGWRSPVYGSRESCPVLRIGTQSMLPVEFVTVLAPVARAGACAGLLRPFQAASEKNVVRAYEYSSADVTSHMFFSEEATTWYAGEWVSDAQFLFHSQASRSNVDSLALAHGSHLSFCGRQLLLAPEEIPWKEWSSERISSSRRHEIVPAPHVVCSRH